VEPFKQSELITYNHVKSLSTGANQLWDEVEHNPHPDLSHNSHNSHNSRDSIQNRSTNTVCIKHTANEGSPNLTHSQIVHPQSVFNVKNHPIVKNIKEKNKTKNTRISTQQNNLGVENKNVNKSVKDTKFNTISDPTSKTI